MHFVVGERKSPLAALKKQIYVFIYFLSDIIFLIIYTLLLLCSINLETQTVNEDLLGFSCKSENQLAKRPG